jgi:lysozyme family protein
MPTMLILPGIARIPGRYDPHGLLDRPSALAYAKARGYEGRVLDVSGETGISSAQTVAALKAFRANITALYGFSGGGYNVRHVLMALTDAELDRIKLVVVLGAPLNPPSAYRGPWELVYRADPPGGHMDGPRALLAKTERKNARGDTIMPASDFDEALKRVLAHEGGYTNDPDDPGGPTNFGITIGDYRACVNPRATAADVRSMPVETAKKIYRENYWNALRCDELPAGVDYAVFDYGVNSGIGRAAKILRVELGAGLNPVPASGTAITDEVIAAAKKADAKKLINDICDERINFLRALPTWDRFGRGWSRRVVEVRIAALAMAKGEPQATTIVLAQPPNAPAAGKAPPPPPPPLSATQATGLVAGGGIVALLAHFAGAHPLAIAGVFILAALAIAAIMFEKGAKA